MPQLMPLNWIMSSFIVFFLVFMMMLIYFDMNNNGNIIVKDGKDLNLNWEW